MPFRVLGSTRFFDCKKEMDGMLMESIEKMYGWNANGFLFRMRDNGKIRKISPLFPVLFYLEPYIPQNTTGRDDAQFLPSKPGRRLRPIQISSASPFRLQTPLPMRHSPIPGLQKFPPQAASSLSTHSSKLVTPLP